MHDRKGNVIAIGDKVWVPCVVKNTYATEEYCNVTLQTEEPMYPSTDRYDTITLNARQTEKQN